MIPFILSATLALLNSFTATVTIDGNEVDVGGSSEREQPVRLPSLKYRCTRLPVTHAAKTMSVMLGCADSADRPLFVIGALCRTDVPDNDLAVIVLNVAPDGEKPRPVQIALSCKTYREGYNL